MQRRLAAILSADIAGYSRLVGPDEEGTIAALREHQAAVLPLIAEHGWRVIDMAGDGFLAEFPSVVGAVRCALAIQAAITSHDEGVTAECRLEYRIGVNSGEIVDGERVYGDGINVAARLQASADAGGIAVSGRVYEDVVGKLDAAWRDRGDQTFKNIARPIRMYDLPALAR
jgi:adenylate cyclase